VAILDFRLSCWTINLSTLVPSEVLVLILVALAVTRGLAALAFALIANAVLVL